MTISFTEQDGVRMATLPAADLERLMEAAEDLADIAAFDAATARRAAGEEYIPAAMVDRMLAGESPLRVWRQHRALTLQALGERAGIKPSYLSEIELGKKPGTPAIWRKLAPALRISVDDIMADDDADISEEAVDRVPADRR